MAAISTLDTAHRVATPEGIELNLRVAGPVSRALAWLIDLAWRLGVLLMLVFVTAPIGEIGTAIFLLCWFALEWLVPAAFESRGKCATPGKRALGLMVVRDDGAPCTLGPALTRNLLRFADFLPMLYFGGLTAMLSNRQFKRLGDFVAGTLVVYADPASVARRIPAMEPRRPPLSLKPDEARTILDFAERAPTLGAARAAELAAIATPLLRGDEPPAQQLSHYANYLVGHASD
jgi:uncharacterized RDD family membrane protein YckC